MSDSRITVGSWVRFRDERPRSIHAHDGVVIKVFEGGVTCLVQGERPAGEISRWEARTGRLRVVAPDEPRYRLPPRGQVVLLSSERILASWDGSPERPEWQSGGSRNDRLTAEWSARRLPWWPIQTEEVSSRC